MTKSTLPALVALAILAGCQGGTQEDKIVTPMMSATSAAPIPPIDKAVPAKIETATFALG